MTQTVNEKQVFRGGGAFPTVGSAQLLGTASDGSVQATGRQLVAATSASLANAAHQEAVVAAMGKSYLLFAVHTDRAARVRLYATTALRDADAGRAVGVDPSAGSGLIVEVVTAGAQMYPLSPTVHGADLTGMTVGALGTPSSNAACSITNLSGATSAVVVTFVIITLEA